MKEYSSALFKMLLSVGVFIYTLLRSTRNIQIHSLLFVSMIDFVFFVCTIVMYDYILVFWVVTLTTLRFAAVKT